MNIYTLCAVGVFIVILKFLSPILIYPIIALFLTILLVPIFSFFDKKGLPAIIAYFITLLGFIAIVGIIGIILDSSLKEFNNSLPIYQDKLNTLLKEINKLLHSFNIEISSQLISSKYLVTLLKKILSNFSNIIKGFLIVLIGVSFLLFESKDFSKKINKISKDTSKFKELFKSVQKYFLIKTFTSLLTGLFVGIMLYLFQVPYVFLFGFLAFILNYIPVIGSIVAAIPGILLTLLTFGFESAIYVTILYIIINISISNILEPKIMGEGLDLSPAVVFFSLIFWGWIFGIAGTFFAVVLTMSLKIALSNSPKTKWISILLAKA
ncbi:MAG: AI-2E family transporter [Epsilonproteobacteria bacterium]|nr:AI-2E family transporter [Campylobacterota bacterium]